MDACDEITESLLAGRARLATLLRRAATIADASEADARAASPYVVRDLTFAVALRVCDHADSVLPRLRGRCPDIDRALALLVRDHRHALELVRRLPTESDWHDVVILLGYGFTRSIALEDDVVLPAIESITAIERRTIAREMRMRRLTNAVRRAKLCERPSLLDAG